MSKVILFSLLMIFSVFISSISQIALKKSAAKSYKNKLSEYLNPIVLFSYIIFFFSSLMNVIALKHVPLSLAPIIESLGYVFVVIIGKVYLKETSSPKKMLGMFIIIGGIFIFLL